MERYVQQTGTESKFGEDGGNVGVKREEKSWKYNRMGRRLNIQSCIPGKSDICVWQFGHRHSEKEHSRGKCLGGNRRGNGRQTGIS